MKYLLFLATILAIAAAQKCKSTGCSKYGKNYCCSYWGYCGTSTDYCGSGKYQCVCDCAAKGPCVKNGSSTTKPSTSCSNKCTTTALNVRSGPGTNYKKLKTLSTGAKVCVASTSNGWSKLNDGTYVSASYLGSCPSNNSNQPISGNSNEEKIWNFLYGKIGNSYGVAGLMGNLKAESGLLPNNLQNSYERSLGYSDASYTAAVDSGKYTNFVRDSAGYGLAQWTYWSRKENLLKYAKSKGTSIGDLTMQLEFLWNELSSGYSSVVSTLKSAKSVFEASNAVLLKFERPANQGTTVQNTRASFGQEYFNKYNGKKSTSSSNSSTAKPSTSCSNKCTTTALNVRSGPGTNYKKLKTLSTGAKVCVASTSNGWSKLNDGTYVSASYLGSCQTSSSQPANNGSFFAQKNFSKTASSAEKNIRQSGCLFLCYCKSAGITTKQGIINAYNKCVNAGAMRSDCYIYHYKVKEQLGISKKVNLVLTKSSSSYGTHWLIKNSDNYFWDPWDGAVHPKSNYKVTNYYTY